MAIAAVPVPCLLAEFVVVGSQAVDQGAQLIHFRARVLHRGGQLWEEMTGKTDMYQLAIHDQRWTCDFLLCPPRAADRLCLIGLRSTVCALTWTIPNQRGDISETLAAGEIFPGQGRGTDTIRVSGMLGRRTRAVPRLVRIDQDRPWRLVT